MTTPSAEKGKDWTVTAAIDGRLTFGQTREVVATLAAQRDELLVQLKTLLAKWDSIDESSPVPDEINDSDDWSWDDVRAAIARAEGSQP